MLKPVADRAEVAIDFPEKSFMGSFGQSSAYEVKTDAEGATLRLTRREGERRTIEMHLHWQLMADVLDGLAAGIEASPVPDDYHRPLMLAAAERLAAAVRAKG